ncbi:MAG: hypothetical protein AAFS10_02460 [Myxococcota bacterium]
MTHQHRSTALWIGLVTLLICPPLGIGCGQREPEEKPIPRSNTPTGEVSRIETGRHLGRAVALTAQDGSPVLVTVDFAQGLAAAIHNGQQTQTLELSRRPVRALYPVGKDSLLALESGGRQVFRLAWDGTLKRTKAVDLCERPRLADVTKTDTWILCRSARDNLHRLSTTSLEANGAWTIPGTLSDMVADPEGHWLYLSDLTGNIVRVFASDSGTEIRTIPVHAEPLRMVVAQGSGKGNEGGTSVVLTHNNSPHLTWLNTGEHAVEHLLKLDVIPSHVVAAPDGRYLYVLAAGAGKLLVVSMETKTVRQSYTVPVGAVELAWLSLGSEERLLMSSGPAGELWVWRPEFENLRLLKRLPMRSAAGRISVGAGREHVWLLGPQSGQVVRFRIP